jgi:hypothetical protein
MTRPLEKPKKLEGTLKSEILRHSPFKTKYLGNKKGRQKRNMENFKCLRQQQSLSRESGEEKPGAPT